MSAVTGAVLVGGQSRRMGVDKASLLIGGRPLAAIVADALRPVCDEVLLCGRAVPGVEARVVRDPEGAAGAGPLAGIVAATEAARTPLLAAAACDMPCLVTALLVAMIGRLSSAPEHGAVMCVSDRGVEPFPLVLRTASLPVLRAALSSGAGRLRDAVAGVDPILLAAQEWSRVDPEGASFVNWNTPDDVRQDAAAQPRMPGHDRD